ncbi:MAG: hypothetical protein U0235_03180 [Polyangiaceae bacterium]
MLATVLFILGPIVGVAVFFLGLRWALGSHRRERAPWLSLLDTPAAAASGAPGVLEGFADDAGGAIAPMEAPMTGRACMAFHVEIITQEQFANTTTWRRVFEDARGQALLRGPAGEPRGHVDLTGAGVIFPPSLDQYTKLAAVVGPETVFQGTIDRAPPRVGWFVQMLPPDVQHMIARPSGQLVGGKRVYFNERIVVPGQPLVVGGRASPGPHGLSLSPSHGDPVVFALGTVASERARVAKLPVAGEAFGAFFGGVIACALVEMVASMLAR